MKVSLEPIWLEKMENETNAEGILLRYTVRSHQNGISVKWDSEPQKLCKLFAVKWDFSKMGIWSPPDQAHQSKWEHGPYSLKYNTL